MAQPYDPAQDRKRVRQELSENPLYQVIADGRRWFCPFCAEVGSRRWPVKIGDQVEEVLDHFYARCAAWNKFRGELKSQGELEEQKALRELRTRCKRDLSSKAEWQFSDIGGVWFCPFCVTETDAVIPENRTMTEDILSRVIDHVHGCAAYQRARGREQSVAYIQTMVTRANKTKRLRDTIRRYVREKRPVWLQRSADGDWLCAYCHKPVMGLKARASEELSSARGIAEHLVHECPSFTDGNRPTMARPAQAGAGPRRVTRPSEPLLEPEMPTPRLPEPMLPEPLLPDPLAAASLLDDPLDEDHDEEQGWPIMPDEDESFLEESGAVLDDDLLVSDSIDISDSIDAVGITLENLERSGAVQRVTEGDLPQALRRDGEAAPQESSSLDEWRVDLEREFERARAAIQATREDAGPLKARVTEVDLLGQARAGMTALFPPMQGFEIACEQLAGTDERGDFMSFFEIGRYPFFALGTITARDQSLSEVRHLLDRLLVMHTRETRDPADILRGLRADIVDELAPRTRLSILFAFLDDQRGRVSFARAGLFPPVVVRPSKRGRVRVEDRCDPPIGAEDPRQDSLRSTRLKLALGDLLVVHTAGAHEVRNRRREPFGAARFDDLLERYSSHEAEYFVDKVREKVEMFTRFEAPSHDLTILALKRRPVGGSWDESGSLEIEIGAD